MWQNKIQVLTFDEFLLTKGLDVEDESEQNKVQLELERRSFDLKELIIIELTVSIAYRVRVRPNIAYIEIFDWLVNERSLKGC